ncbi:MAG: LacI family DNA-binding transcriptional regulator [Planctomycetes bacterium]|nr:LacI family DNA-binding transcriptional regulator [Planctomycetota bacterium]
MGFIRVKKSCSRSRKSNSSKCIGIKYIAEEAGCSISTVSRIINNYPDFNVSREVREKVLAVAMKHNYSPHPIFKAISSKKTWMVSLLDYNRLSGEMVSVMRKSIVPVLQKNGYQVGCNFIDSKGESPDSYFPDWKVDGVAFADADDVAKLAQLDEAGLPYVSMNGVCGSGGVGVITDEHEGMRLAIDHLSSLGHRNIAYAVHDGFLFSPFSLHMSIEIRKEGYLNGMSEAGLNPMPLQGDIATPLDIHDFLEKVIKEHKATALIGYNVFTGMELLLESWRLGYSVPDRLSVICFDDLYPSALAIPPLTCIKNPASDIGVKSGEFLVRLIDGDDSLRGKCFSVKPELTVRESTATAPCM